VSESEVEETLTTQARQGCVPELTIVCPLCVRCSVAERLRPCRTEQPQPPQSTASLPSAGPTSSALSPSLDTRNCSGWSLRNQQRIQIRFVRTIRTR
jgi:hypothetical protein